MKKKAVVKKKKMPAKKAPAKKQAVLRPIGTVTHFYTAIKVAIIKFKKPVKVGATIGFRGATTKYDQKISSMQFDHKPILVAKKGHEVGLKVGKRVREGDEVFEI